MIDLEKPQREALYSVSHAVLSSPHRSSPTAPGAQTSVGGARTNKRGEVSERKLYKWSMRELQAVGWGPGLTEEPQVCSQDWLSMRAGWMKRDPNREGRQWEGVQ